MAASPKNKKLTIILIIAVVIIWGTIVYKFLSSVGEKPSVKKNIGFVAPRQYKPDSDYVLGTIERDPFLSILTDTAIIIEDTIKNIHTPPIRNNVNYPKPVYCGLIRNEHTNMAIIKVDNQYHFLEKGKKDSVFKVLNIKDSIVVILYHGQKISLILENKQK